MTENSKDTGTSWSDPDDAQELTDEFFNEAELYEDDKFVQKGRGKQKAAKKELVSIRLSPEVLEYFRGTGPGWQTRVDNSLKTLIARKQLSDTLSEVKSVLSATEMLEQIAGTLREMKETDSNDSHEAS